VVERGPGVKTLQPGDHVIPLYIPEYTVVPEIALARINKAVPLEHPP
jgi:Zn-dependent alcohol dehydrogenase